MNLDKALRAMQHCEAWQSRVQGACLLTGKEYGQPVLSTMTNHFLDDLDYDAETLTVTVPAGIDAALLEAVEEYEPPAESSHVQDLTDAQIVEQINKLRVEQDRRANLQQALAQSPVLAEAFQRDVLDREPGQEWKQPLGAFDAYPLGWEVQYMGRDWVSLVDANVWEPGVSGWREVGVEGAPVEWVQPSGAHDAYQQGDQVIHDGHLWESTADHNVWRPGEYGWDDLGPVEDYKN